MIHNRSLPSLLSIVLVIVLSLRKVPIEQYIYSRPCMYFPLSLASSTHYLPSNLVPLLGLSLVLIPTDFNCHTIALQVLW